MHEAEGEAYERLSESLKGQGVTQRGSWALKDLLNWGVAEMATWDFDKYSARARGIRWYIERNRSMRTDKYGYNYGREKE